MHHDRMKLLRRQLSDPCCGSVRRVSVSFSFNGSNGNFLADNIRVKYDCDPLGERIQSFVLINNLSHYFQVPWVIWAGTALELD